MSSLAERKQRLRKEAARRRDAIAKEQDIGEALVDAFERHFDLQPGLVVSGYHPIGSEANLLPLLLKLRDSGIEVALPVVIERQSPLTFRRWTEDTDLQKGPFGILEPGADTDDVQPNLILAPLLAFDAAGNRLGYGGGFYDLSIRAIRKCQPVDAIGAAYSGQRVSSVPHDDNDMVLDGILTETGFIQPSSGAS